MKLQAASKKEIARIAKGIFLCDLIMVAALFLLSLLGVGAFSPLRILLGVAGGSVVAIGNFTLLCLTVQKAAATEDQKLMKRRFQASYNFRLVFQAAWVVVCFLVPQIHLVAGALPVFFPNLVIYFLQVRGKLVPAGEKKETPAEDIPTSPADSPEEPEDHLETFEV